MNKHIGSSFDDFLEEENLLIETSAEACIGLANFQLSGRTLDYQNPICKTDENQSLPTRQTSGSSEYQYQPENAGRDCKGNGETCRNSDY